MGHQGGDSNTNLITAVNYGTKWDDYEFLNKGLKPEKKRTKRTLKMLTTINCPKPSRETIVRLFGESCLIRHEGRDARTAFRKKVAVEISDKKLIKLVGLAKEADINLDIAQPFWFGKQSDLFHVTASDESKVQELLTIAKRSLHAKLVMAVRTATAIKDDTAMIVVDRHHALRVRKLELRLQENGVITIFVRSESRKVNISDLKYQTVRHRDRHLIGIATKIGTSPDGITDTARGIVSTLLPETVKAYRQFRKEGCDAAADFIARDLNGLQEEIERVMLELVENKAQAARIAVMAADLKQAFGA